ncbi:MAG: type II toxin-antitoxin system HicA family toxin [Chloroflexota bacterium]
MTKVRDAVKRIEADGWQLIRQTGGHRQFKHPTKSGLVTVPGNPAHELPPGTMKSILKQAGIMDQS